MLEHPDQLIVRADTERLRSLLAELLQIAINSSLHRAEIRLELGARPGCSFFLRDNGSGLAPTAAAVERISATHGAGLRIDTELDWGATVHVLLVPARADDDTRDAPYTAPLSPR